MHSTLPLLLLLLLGFFGGFSDAADLGGNSTLLEECLGGDLIAVKTKTVHPFVMAVLPQRIDKGVSKELSQGGIFDAMVLAPFQFILQRSPCDSTSAVADVGANVGFFSFFSLSMHCRVLIFEPQQRAGSCINATLCLNSRQPDFKTHTDFFNLPVSNKSFVSFPLSYKEVGNTGGIGSYMCAGGVMAPGFRPHDCNKRLTANLDGLFGYGPHSAMVEWRKNTRHATRLRVLKIDTEGYEYDVMDSASVLLSKGLVDNVLFEVSPFINGIETNFAMMERLASFGYKFAHLPYYNWRHVSNFTHPFHARVIPLGNNMTAVRVLLEALIEGTKVPKWRGTFQTDIWASLTEGIFEAFNLIVH